MATWPWTARSQEKTAAVLLPSPARPAARIFPSAGPGKPNSTDGAVGDRAHNRRSPPRSSLLCILSSQSPQTAIGTRALRQWSPGHLQGVRAPPSSASSRVSPVQFGLSLLRGLAPRARRARHCAPALPSPRPRGAYPPHTGKGPRWASGSPTTPAAVDATTSAAE